MKSLAEAYLDVSLTIPIDDTQVKRRLDRAYDIVRLQGYDITSQYDGSYVITRGSTSLLEDNTAQYITSTATCTCPDFDKARGNLCKHRLAIMLYEVMYDKS